MPTLTPWRLAMTLASSLAATATSAQIPAPLPEPPCAVASDPAYAAGPDTAAQVGGGAMYAAARQRRFLDALRGPNGEAVRYTRRGSTPAPGRDEPLDAYEVTWDGLAAPRSLFLDAYQFFEPKAPAGFTCGKAMQLGVPPPDMFAASEDLRALAAAIAREPGFRAGPVDLGGEPPVGVLLDEMRLRSRRVRPGTEAPAADPAVRSVVVAYPQTCGGRSVPATGVALVARGDGRPIEATRVVSDGAAIAAAIPGGRAPAGSVVAMFPVDALLAGMQVRVSFADTACPAATRDSALSFAASRLLEAPMPVRPEGDASGAAWIGVAAIVDHQGTFQAVRAMGGPPALRAAAEAAVRTWKARPALAGDAPIATPVTLQVQFLPAPR